MSNGVDPDETANHEPSHMYLRCLQKPILSHMAVNEPINYQNEQLSLKPAREIPNLRR